MDRKPTYVNHAAFKPKKFHEGWVEHKFSKEKKWRKYWCILKGSVIFIFSSNSVSAETHVGNLTIGPESRLEKRSGDEKNGFKFDLYTKRRINTFKTTKFSERELWRAYVTGIATGNVSNNIDLLPGQLDAVRRDLGLLNVEPSRPTRAVPEPPVQPGRRDSEPANVTLPDGFDTPNASASGGYGDEYLQPCDPKSDGVGASPASIELQVQSAATSPGKHAFHAEPSRTDTPSWFFHNCSRAKAEEILTHCSSYGNTLMREHSDNPNSFKISKRTDAVSGCEIRHYQIMKRADGFVLDVDNPHKPMKMLSEVMDFFLTCAGVNAKPMSCNDCEKLCKGEFSPYSTKIITNTGVPAPTRHAETVAYRQSEPSQVSAGPHTVMPKIHRNVPSVKQIPFQEHGPAPAVERSRQMEMPSSPPPPPPPASSPPPVPCHKKKTSPLLSPQQQNTSANFPPPKSLTNKEGPQAAGLTRGCITKRSMSVPNVAENWNLNALKSWNSIAESSAPAVAPKTNKGFIRVNQTKPLKEVEEPTPPPLPLNHPPPLKKNSKDLGTSVKEYVTSGSDNVSPGLKSAAFKNKLENLFANSLQMQSQEPTSSKSAKLPSPASPDLPEFPAPPPDFLMYESLDHYQNAEEIRNSQTK